MTKLTRILRVGALALALWATTARADDQLNVNTASEQELEKLPGVGAATAKRIVEYRDQNGPFESVDDLQKVKGISAATIEKFKGFVFAGTPSGSGRPKAPVAAAPAMGAGGLGSREEISALHEEEASSADVKKLLARYKDEPSVRDVQDAAMHYAEVHPERIASWQGRSRMAALAPQFRAEYRYVGDSTDRVKTGGDTAPTQQNDLGVEHRPLVRAQWDLDRLVFNPDELRVSNEVTDLVRLRESVLDQVTKIYYERRRLQVDLDLTPPKDIAGRVRKELRLQELVADLDALTGGFFSKKLTESGLDPY